MTLLITVFAAIIATIFWYRAGAKDEMKISTLCYLYWGASLMWFIDAVFEYAELRAEYFTPAAADMLNDTFLGFSAVALGLVIWLAVVLWKDPKGKWRNIATNH
ncbi:MAG: hypothetical protein IKH55_14920 [Fibrobacter sp.]|jgi:hypothetical protein|nr:hypothetical protein [Fibrobacter sp.]